MSINISAFFGNKIENLDARFIQAFLDIGFHVQLHPALTLVESNLTGCIYLNVIKSPPRLRRLEPESSLLVSFGYEVQKRQKNASRSAQWPPKEVGNYSYEANSRTASGRSFAAATMQSLTMAILAKETEGYFYVDGEKTALTGDLALKRIVQEFEQFWRLDFDAYAYRFESWPSMNDMSSFKWPQEIVPSYTPTIKIQKRKFKFKYKFSLFHLPYLLIAYFLVVTLLYS